MNLFCFKCSRQQTNPDYEFCPYCGESLAKDEPADFTGAPPSGKTKHIDSIESLPLGVDGADTTSSADVVFGEPRPADAPGVYDPMAAVAVFKKPSYSKRREQSHAPSAKKAITEALTSWMEHTIAFGGEFPEDFSIPRLEEHVLLTNKMRSVDAYFTSRMWNLPTIKLTEFLRHAKALERLADDSITSELREILTELSKQARYVAKLRVQGAREMLERRRKKFTDFATKIKESKYAVAADFNAIVSYVAAYHGAMEQLLQEIEASIDRPYCVDRVKAYNLAAQYKIAPTMTVPAVLEEKHLLLVRRNLWYVIARSLKQTNEFAKHIFEGVFEDADECQKAYEKWCEDDILPPRIRGIRSAPVSVVQICITVRGLNGDRFSMQEFDPRKIRVISRLEEARFPIEAWYAHVQQTFNRSLPDDMQLPNL